MYRIVKDGAALALIEAPTYVRQAGNGCFGPCTTCWAGRPWREPRA